MQVFKQFQFAFLFFLFCFFVCHHECAGKAGNSRKQQIISLIRLHPEDMNPVFKSLNTILNNTQCLFWS